MTKTKGKEKRKEKNRENLFLLLLLLLFDTYSHKVNNFKHFSLTLFLVNMASLHRVDQLCIYIHAKIIIIDETTVNLQGERYIQG
jgi:hypothetical protein